MICLQGACWCPFLSFLHRLASHLRDGSSGQTGRCRCALAAWKNHSHETRSVADDLRTNHPPDSWVFPSFQQVTSARYPAGPCGDDEDARVEGEITCDPVIMDDTSKFVFQNLCGRMVLIHFKNVLKKHIHISADPRVIHAWLGYSLVSLYMIIYRVAHFSNEVLPASKCFGSISFVFCA